MSLLRAMYMVAEIQLQRDLTRRAISHNVPRYPFVETRTTRPTFSFEKT